MRACILNFVFFSIIICFFWDGRNELHYVNERSVSLERNIINFRNNRILADADNQFDLNNFYQSALSLANQFSDCNDDDGEIAKLRNTIDSHITKHKESNTLPNLNNLDKKTKKLIRELQKELEETKKELDNISSNELEIQPIHDKRMLKKDENNFVSEQENFKHLENKGIFLKIEDYNFENKYHEIASSDTYKEFKTDRKLKKAKKKLIITVMLFIVSFLVIIASGGKMLLLLLIPCGLFVIKDWWEVVKLKYDL
ncbi:fam-b protein [Plasmodium vinckei petteri]|uniref:Fam-b protein n=1 Tax=Plasmodium vinckei petteri TaxID=138298 RepID=A0A6V7SH18_PLAVN|nr:fam-b protein [Plasmodium vinckei petteri]